MGFRERHGIPDLGVGIGARTVHYQHIFEERPLVDWFEVISENVMTARGGKPRSNFEALFGSYRVVPHGVSLSIGGTDPIDSDYLARLREVVRRIDPPWFSDHLCFTGAGGRDLHDLLPLPYTLGTAKHVAERIKKVQDAIGRPFAVENVSSYMTYRASEMTEWEFLTEVSERADCGILFDCNNVYVSARNHGFEANAYVDGIPADRVVQMHLAGHTDRGDFLLDTHSDRVADPVWNLYARALRRTGPVATLVEWDEDIPAFEVVAEEAERARKVRRDVFGAEPANRDARAT